MTDHQQPEALRLAEELDNYAKFLPAYGFTTKPLDEAAAELRRLHAESIEQARLLGMSAERELALRARCMEIETHGPQVVRGVSEDGTLRMGTMGQALLDAREAADAEAQYADSLRAENEALRKDAECFRFWVSEAARSPSAMANLIAKCTTEAEYRAVILPVIEARRAAIDAAREAQATETRLSGEAK